VALDLLRHIERMRLDRALMEVQTGRGFTAGLKTDLQRAD
jgi:ribosomal protein L13E